MKKILLCGSLLLATGAFSQVLTEDFEGLGGALPSGWTSVSTTPGAGSWVTGNAALSNAGGFWPVPAHTNFAQVNDDICNCNLSAAYLVSPVMNFTGLSGVALQYSFVDDLSYGGNPHLVEVTTNGGSTWTNVYTYAPTAANINWQDNLVSLGAATDNASAVQVRFKYDDAGAWATGLAIDDVVVQQPLLNDAKLLSASVARFALINTNSVLSVDVQNVGGNAITSLTIDWNDGTSHAQTISASIAPGAVLTVAHPTALNYATAVEKNLNVTVTQVNSVADANPTNNTGATVHNTVSTVAPKAVVIEEGTGTWCGWCPRGAVAMEALTTAHPTDFIGIAVHNGDPMTVTAYDGGANFSGFPGANVDRALLGVSVSTNLFNQYYNDRVTIAVPASVSVGGNVIGNSIQVFAGAHFYTPMTGGNYRLAAVVSEDGVTGTTSAYNQANYYSGGGQGVMGGYELLSDPVPAADMVYDHVGRALLGGYDGQAGSVPATIVDGTLGSATWTYTVPATSDIAKMHIVVLLIDNNTGEIINAIQSSVSQLVGLSELVEAIDMKVYPNPATDLVNISFDANGGDYSVTATDMAGVTISTLEMTNASGAQKVSLPVSGLASGVYFITVSHNGVSSTKRIVVQ